MTRICAYFADDHFAMKVEEEDGAFGRDRGRVAGAGIALLE